MSQNKLFSPYILGDIELKNRIVMPAMTRSRAIANVPNDLMKAYYSQRASAGLIITEGVAPSPNGLGYARIPGIFTQEQINGWKKVAHAVHARNGQIFMQLMHPGRIGHPFNLPQGASLIAPSTVRPAVKIWTDSDGTQQIPIPKEMSPEALASTKQEFVRAAQNAMEAGFDGIELHAGSGYLLEQFLSPFTNQRKDEYGGSIEGRSRYVLEVTEAVSDAIGKEKLGIKLSPYSVANDMAFYLETDDTYTYLAEELNQLNIAYIHIVDNTDAAPSIPLYLKQDIGRLFHNTIIVAGGYLKEKAEQDLQNGLGDLVAFGRLFISHPDLALRLQNGWPLSNTLDPSTFYTSDEKGFIDYPAYMEEPVIA